MTAFKLKVLLVEDDRGDVKAVRRAFAKARFDCELTVASDGVEALEAMRDVHTPNAGFDIVVVDINMPRMDGLEFLGELRADEFSPHPVAFVLTTSADEGEVLAAYELGIAGYITKASAGPAFIDFAQMISGFSDLVQFPTQAGLLDTIPPV